MTFSRSKAAPRKPPRAVHLSPINGDLLSANGVDCSSGGAPARHCQCQSCQYQSHQDQPCRSAPLEPPTCVVSRPQSQPVPAIALSTCAPVPNASLGTRKSRLKKFSKSLLTLPKLTQEDSLYGYGAGSDASGSQRQNYLHVVNSELRDAITSMFSLAVAPVKNEESVERDQRVAPVKNEESVEGDQPHDSQDDALPRPTELKSDMFSKANLYANARVPGELPPVRLCGFNVWFSAQFSERSYKKPVGEERQQYVPADARLGTKALYLKSVPVDTMNVIVFAVRGTKGTMDWITNFKESPASPEGFLEDVGNLCHAGFLNVARKMVKPVAARLRALLEQNPARARSSFLITGHSAGGAIASLLYSHMLCTSPGTDSELNRLTRCFRRIHCVTFGSPPVSLLPLKKPLGDEGKNLFLSFINEGDPVARISTGYFTSLLNLYATSAYVQPIADLLSQWESRARGISTGLVNGTRQIRGTVHATSRIWPMSAEGLSLPGRIMLLREAPRSDAHPKIGESVQAYIVTDEQLRGVVFGDLPQHYMERYQHRIEALAQAS